MFVTSAMLLAAITNAATAKSLYVIGDVKGSSTDATQPVHAYDIGVDGTLAFQAQHDIPHRDLGAVGLAIDSDSGYLFVTYEASGDIQLVDGITMTDAGEVAAEGATNLAGIVYDHGKKLLYCVDRAKERLYSYDWDAKAVTLTPVAGSPFTLSRAQAFGIALDEIDGLLYMANANRIVTVYDTSNWSLVDRIDLSRVAIGIAVDVMNGFVYTGGAWVGNNYLTQYHLATGTEAEVQVDSDAGVMGIGVDPATGLVYMTTGKNNAPGGDDLLVYDMKLNLVDKTHIGGNPAGLAIPGKNIGFNPFNLTKTLISGAAEDTPPGEMPLVDTGQPITYGIGFNNLHDSTVTGVSIVDALPRGVTFVSADNDGAVGQYDSKSHTYTWTYANLPPGSSAILELTVLVKTDVEDESVISNSVTIHSNETPSTTTRLDAVAVNDSLNLEKTIKGAGQEPVVVEPNEIITYTICFDNNDNDFTAKDVLVIDALPPEVEFINVISAGKDAVSGNYDQKSHTFTWGPQDMAPGSSVCFDLVVRVLPDVPSGTVIRNSAVISGIADGRTLPPSMVSVDATTSSSGLVISKAIVGNPEGKLTLVGEGENITYIICFENRNTETISGVTVVDALPDEVSLIKTSSDGAPGLYDSKTHTFTWSFPSLEPNAKSPACVELVVRVNKGVAPATIITNTATISSRETPSITVINSNAATYFYPLELTKFIIGGFGDDVEWVDIGDEVVYGIEYTNNNEFHVTNVIITDKLPKEVSFVTADHDGVFGSYDPDSHTYQWAFPSLGAGESAMVELVVNVNPDVEPFTTITNSVNIDSDQTVVTPSGPTPTVDVITAEPPVPVRIIEIMPDVIRRAGDTYDVQVIMILPEGIRRDDIRDVLPILKPGNVRAKRHVIQGGDTIAKVVAFFDKAEILEAIGADGYVTLRIKGKLNSGQSFVGEATVYISRFTGN